MEIMKRGTYKFENRDCMEAMREYPDKYFDLAIVDPPYGIGEDGRKTKGRDYERFDPRNGNKIYCSPKPYKSAGWDNKTPNQKYFDELFRVSKKIIVWGENYFSFAQKEQSSGRIVWDKVNGDNDFSDCEIAWTNCCESVRQIEFMWAGFLQGLSIKEGRTQQGNKSLNESRIHPTQKPVALYKWLLSKYAKEGDKILDTHGGSCSSVIACLDMGFDITCYELDKDYFEASKRRIDDYLGQGTLKI